MEEKETNLVKINEDITQSTKEVAANIVEAENQDEFKKLVDLFNLNQSKKNALRIIKLNGLLDNIEDQAIERFEKRPDQMSNQEVLEYLKAIENSIDRSQKIVDKIEDKPMIQINQQNNTINVKTSDATALDKESKEQVLDLVASLIKQLQSPDTEVPAEEDIIDYSTDEEEGEE